MISAAHDARKHSALSDRQPHRLRDSGDDTAAAIRTDSAPTLRVSLRIKRCLSRLWQRL